MADTIRFVFLATGSMDGRTVAFSHNARFRMVELVKDLNRRRKTAPELQPLPARVRFVHFDFDDMKIRAYEHPFADKKVTTPPTGKWDLLTKLTSTSGTQDEDPKRFVDTSTNANNELSITNVYHSVRGAPKGSVLEVGVYSHAFVEGPILVNTSDDPTSMDPDKPALPLRLLTDCDGRARTDFAENMGEESKAQAPATVPVKSGGKDALKEFKDKLAPQATLRVYGCNAQDVVSGEFPRAAALMVVNAAAKAQRAAINGSKQPKDDLVFDLEMWDPTMIDAEINEGQAQWKALSQAKRNEKGNARLTLHRFIDQDFFPAPNPDPKKPPTVRTVSKTWKEIRRFLALKVQQTYIFTAAVALTPSGAVCHGAIPGVGGNNESTKDLALGQMRVCAAKAEVKGCDDSFGLQLSVFKKFMNVKLDKRHYGIFDADTVTAINDLAKP